MSKFQYCHSDDFPLLLSILVPAYSYPSGVRRIMREFGAHSSSQCEVLIFDDSPGDEVKQIIEAWREQGMPLRYQRNVPSLGVAGNWNALLEAARGEYCLLMHHDEFPLGSNFVGRALDVLRKNPDTDVLMMDCVLVGDDGRVARRHVPNLLRSWVARHVPAYLFRRNVIGPASALIVRRSLYPRFDDKLRWLIDVDAYFRLRQSTASWRVCGDLKIGSTLGRKDSITASIKDELKDLDAQERAYLVQKHPTAGLWLRADAHRWARAAETVLWAFMRVFTRLYARILSLFGILPVAEIDLKKALNK